MTSAERDKEAKADIAEARNLLGDARTMFGNDHPVYNLLQEIRVATLAADDVIDEYARKRGQ